MSENEKNPLSAIRKLKELSRSLTEAGRPAEKKNKEEKKRQKPGAASEKEGREASAGKAEAPEGSAEEKNPGDAGRRPVPGKRRKQESPKGEKRTGEKRSEGQEKENAGRKEAAKRKEPQKQKAAEKLKGAGRQKAADKLKSVEEQGQEAPLKKRRRRLPVPEKTAASAAEAAGAAEQAEEQEKGRKRRRRAKTSADAPARSQAEEPKKRRERGVKPKAEPKVLTSSVAGDLRRAKLPAVHPVRTVPGAKVKIIPLGGLEQIGMNMTAFEYGDSIVVVDCGIAFPSEDMLGIDCIIPDVTYLKDNRSKVKGFVITHGHEDHIGALPYILKDLNVPVYSTRLTIALIQHKLEEHGLADSAKLFVVKHGDTVPLGDFNVEFIKTNHSISDSSALAIFSPAGIIFHTGDFKIDYTPVFGEAADLQRMAELGKQGVLALLCESTNAIRQGFTMSERTVGRTFDIIFAEHKENRIIVATFASNVDRVQQVINTAYKYGRKVVVEGRSMVNVIGIANELGYISIPKGTLIDIEELKNYPPEQTVIVTTGSQGESMAALSRMAGGTHRKVTITPSDVVVMSSHPIPGNEKAVDNVINELSIKGAEVIFQDTHVSGHACAEEIKLMYSLLRPKFSLPIHGEYRHRKAQVEIAQAVGVPRDNILFMNTGDVVELTENSCRITGRVQAGPVLVDGLGVGDVGNVVLKDRQNIGQNGILIVTLALERATNLVAAGPEIVSRGFVYVKDSEDLMDEAREIAAAAVRDSLASGVTDWSRLKNVMKESLNDFFWKRMKRNPVILPIILGID